MFCMAGSSSSWTAISVDSFADSDELIDAHIEIHAGFLGQPPTTEVTNHFADDSRIGVRKEAAARRLQLPDHRRGMVLCQLGDDGVEISALGHKHFLPLLQWRAGREHFLGVLQRLGGVFFATEKEAGLGDGTEGFGEQLVLAAELAELGDAQIMEELFGSFALAMTIGLLCIYGVLVLLFRDFLQPWTILAALPLSIGGAFVLLLLTGTS